MRTVTRASCTPEVEQAEKKMDAPSSVTAARSVLRLCKSIRSAKAIGILRDKRCKGLDKGCVVAVTSEL